MKQDGLEVTEHAQELDYDYWPADHILRVRALPPRANTVACAVYLLYTHAGNGCPSTWVLSSSTSLAV